ncbi:MAG TPA: hypothetical protein VMU19_15175 [Bryobacteraceae bacterium]|nr:hypothetical protein [Bryobacteraceae bacterium]
MDNYLLKTVAIGTAAIVMAACSSAPAPAPSEAPPAASTAPKPVEPVSGKTAFYEMYKPARQWATDLQPLSLASGELAGFKNADGKAALWTAVFVSPSLAQARHFTYAIATVGTVSRGVSADPPERWSGPTKAAMAFQNSDIQVDSDAAFKTAATKGADWLKEHADKKWTIELGSASRFPAPVWYILWGDAKAGGYAQFVNASTGEIVAK